MSSVEAPQSYTSVSDPEDISDAAYFIWQGRPSKHLATENRCSSVIIVHLHKPGCTDKSVKPRKTETAGSRLQTEYCGSCKTHVSHSWVADEDNPSTKANGLHSDLADGTKETTVQVENRLVRGLCNMYGNCNKDSRDLPVSEVYTQELSD